MVVGIPTHSPCDNIGMGGRLWMDGILHAPLFFHSTFFPCKTRHHATDETTPTTLSLLVLCWGAGENKVVSKQAH